MAGLETYRRKRDFSSTPEPQGQPSESGGRRFVIQKHDARRLHYDLRLEHDGVLLSWAVPKGPSLDPRQRRLAVQTEDHPLEYATFEGTIPAGHYGAGSMLVWDRGIWIPEGDPHKDYERGRMRFALQGEKLHGRWNLVRTKDEKTWLLIKSRDEFARGDDAGEIVDELPRSVLSGRSIADIESGVPEQTVADDQASAPPIITPQLASASERAPEGATWLHEIKLDGYRILAHVRAGEARLHTRGGEDWTDRLPELARVLSNAVLADSILDGEICVLDGNGVSSFDRLQQALAEARTTEVIYSVFDLPFVHGRDLRRTPLLERKQALQQLLAHVESGGRVRYCDHVLGQGPQVFEQACALKVEGIVSKRVDAIYESRRTRTWLKTKCPRTMTVVVGGYSPPRGTRRHFGALLVGSYDDDGQLRYRGKVGSGYSEDTLARLRPLLATLRQDQPPFVDPPARSEARGVQWVAPQLTIDVEYGDLTTRGRIRQGRFVRLREPEPERAREPTRRNPTTPASVVRLTHPDKLLYPERKLSKRDVADYVMRVAEWMLPHLRDRALTLVRCPDGVGGACFFSKHALAGLPANVARVPVRESDGSEELYASVSDALGLVALVQMSTIEIHLWGSRLDHVDCPDRLVFDLDPDEGLDFARVVAAALEIRERLEQLGLRSFVKTTGGKGLHVVVPIEPELDFDRVKQFCRTFAQRMASDAPDRYTAVMSKAERRGKIFIDYLRNGRGATSIAPYSPRAKPDATVSTPLRWDELSASLQPERYTLVTVPERLAKLDHDPWAEIFTLRQSIRALIDVDA
ncbi:MAG TPA: DNA ligase D [Enhygromyxa sp.]|nr:DNA ligase D [Enhygromyxa sp.]